MIYELRDYVAVAGRTAELHQRFADHTLDLFARHGLDVVGFWTDTEDSNRIAYLPRFLDEDTRRAAAAFRDDPEWK